LINALTEKVVFSALLARRGSASWAKTPDFVTGLVGGGLGFGWVDFDAALEVSAVLNADAGREDIADDGAFLLDVHTAADVNVAHDFSGDDQFAGMNFRIETSGGTDRQFVALQRNGTVDLAINLQGLGARELTLDLMLAPRRAELRALVPPRCEFEAELNGTTGAAEP